jgi:beta-fructofuranosidase
VHQVAQQPDGTLSVRMPETVARAFTQPVALLPQPVWGGWTVAADAVAAHADGRHSICSLGNLPDEALVEVTVTYEPGTCACGLLLRADDRCDRYYQLRLEPHAQRMVVDRWPRPGDQPFMLERPLAMQPGQPLQLRVLVSGTCLVVYANDEVALSCRMYEHRDGNLGVFVTEGQARFEDVRLRGR